MYRKYPLRPGTCEFLEGPARPRPMQSLGKEAPIFMKDLRELETLFGPRQTPSKIRVGGVSHPQKSRSRRKERLAHPFTF